MSNQHYQVTEPRIMFRYFDGEIQSVKVTETKPGYVKPEGDTKWRAIENRRVKYFENIEKAREFAIDDLRRKLYDSIDHAKKWSRLLATIATNGVSVDENGYESSSDDR